MTIFVSIASYRDPLLWFTVNDCYKKAKNPKDLVFGIVDQGSIPQHRAVDKTGFADQIRYVFIGAVDARGACWARHLVQSLYHNEDYFLQVDSHSWFDQDWDELCIQLMKSNYTPNPKKLYSCYARGFEFIDGKPTDTSGTKDLIYSKVKEGETLKDHDPLLAFTSDIMQSDYPVPACHIGAGFIFTLGQFVREVPYDPCLYFNGEEQNIAVRAFTHGYDVLHPPLAPVYHFYGRNKEFRHWASEDDELRTVKWYDFAKRSNERMADLLYHKKDLGIYGLGKVRTLRDYATFCGIDYENKVIAPSSPRPPRPSTSIPLINIPVSDSQ